MLRDSLQQLVESAVESLIASGKIPEAARVPVEIADSKNPEHGDFACNFALVASKKAGMPPRAIGELLAEALQIPNTQYPIPLSSIDLAGPGFLNIRLKPEAIAAYVDTILELGTDLPNAAAKEKGPRVNVEFVSVNPNGPITVGSARGAAFGDALVRIFRAAGVETDSEYYINDGVNSLQMRLFAESVMSYALDLPFPENGYKGDYVKDVVTSIAGANSPQGLRSPAGGVVAGRRASKNAGASARRSRNLWHQLQDLVLRAVDA